MTQTLANLRAKKKKNGGFTLVELIIVIAIMAALVAILAPQYMQYVEKSRVAADNSTADQILSACKVAASDTDKTWTDDTGLTIAWSDAASSNLNISNGVAANKTQLASILDTSLSLSGANKFGSGTAATIAQIKSSTYHGKNYTVTIVINNGEPTVSGAWG